ncbi:MAG: Ig-like domain-containing protein [Phycisphaerae bacterium]
MKGTVRYWTTVVLWSAMLLQCTAVLGQGLDVTAPDTFVTLGDSTQLTVTHEEGGAIDDLTLADTGTIYLSSNETVAEVDADGLVTTLTAGAVTIDVINGDVSDEARGFLTGQIDLVVGPPGDRDGDGLPDDYEDANGLDSADPTDAGIDSDGDGLTNLDEFGRGTDPNNPNTDGDAQSDGEEVNGGSDPLVPDVFGGLDETCTASVLNRTVRVNPDGTFSLQNVPTNQGLVRVRVVCDRNGLLIGGFSDFFLAEPNFAVDLGSIVLGPIPPSVESLAVSAEPPTLNKTGMTSQLTVMAMMSDGTQRDVTGSGNGTNYVTSNPAVATVDDSGLVTATGGAVAIISVTNDGVFAAVRVTMAVGDDSDLDGLPDDYERANGLNPDDPTDAAQDPDGDNLTNLEEFNAGTDPNVADTDGDGLRDDAELTLGTSPFIGDTDGDLILDGEEVVSGQDGFVTNPLLADTDGDGLPDGLEIRLGLNPTTQQTTPGTLDGDVDSDDDLLSNLDELDLFTDPGNPDTDGDGLTDGQEVAAGTNPLVPDTDLPIVAITSPEDGSTFIEGEVIRVMVVAIGVGGRPTVELMASSGETFIDNDAPFEFDFTIPGQLPQVTLTATATDELNTRTSAPVTINIIPDPGTTVVGTVRDLNESPVAGATLTTNGNVVGLSEADGTFSLANVPTILGDIIVQATVEVEGVMLNGRSAPVPPVAEGVTDVGVIVVQERIGILLIEDQGGFATPASNLVQNPSASGGDEGDPGIGAEDVLLADGHQVTVIVEEFDNGYANLLDLEFLNNFDLVIWGARGAGFGTVTPQPVADNLEAYIQGGGNLLVTGYDTIGSPTDSILATLVRAVNPGDLVSRDPNWATTDVDNFILNGPFGDFRNLTFSHIGYDDDFLVPDTARGAIILANTPGVTARVIFTDLPAPGGTVGYWNGGVSGTTTNAQPDFSSGFAACMDDPNTCPVPMLIFRNWAAGALFGFSGGSPGRSSADVASLTSGLGSNRPGAQSDESQIDPRLKEEIIRIQQILFGENPG